jgi:uncharacterized membrane protein (TIGR02234 family)
MRARVEFAAAVVMLAIGAAGLLLLATREWQTIGTRSIAVTGRTVDAAPTALGVVALAGAVAVIATKGRMRQVIGVLIAAAGAAAIWRSAAALPAVSASRAEQIVRAKQQVNVIGGGVPEVTTHPVWGALSVVAAVLVLAVGALIAVRGGRWQGMSGRYRAPGDTPAPHRAETTDPDGDTGSRRDASLWAALERGDDPTA